jgi:HNH endonuclease
MKRKHRMGAIGLRIALLHLAAGAWTLTDEGAVLSFDGHRLDFPLRGRNNVSVDLGDSTTTIVSVARIMWTHHFGPIPHHLEVDHIDEDKGNDRIGNLQLLTPKQNMRKHKEHRLAHNGDAELIQRAKQLRAEGVSQCETADLIGRSPSWVSVMTRRSDERAQGAPVTRKINWHKEQADKRRATSEMQ